MTDKKTTTKKATTPRKRKTTAKKPVEKKVEEQIVDLGNKKDVVKAKEVKKSETIIIRR